MPALKTSKGPAKFAENRMLQKLGNVLHRYEIWLQLDDQSPKLSEKIPHSVPGAPCSTAVGGKRLARRTTGEEAIARLAEESGDLITTQVSDIPLDEHCSIVCLVSEPTLRIVIDPRLDVDPSAEKAMSKTSQPAKEINASDIRRSVVR